VLAQDPVLLPALRGDAERPSPVRRPLSAFLGREADVALLTGLVAGHRLVTVVGPAGVGPDPIGVLSSLVSRSMAIADSTAEPTRYRLPATDLAWAKAAWAPIEYAIGDVGHAREPVAGAAQALRAGTGPGSRLLFAEARFYQAVLLLPDGDAELAPAAATEAFRIGVESGLEWLRTSAPPRRRPAARDAHGRAHGRGPRDPALAIRDSLACGMTWTAAVAKLMLGRHLLDAGEPSLHYLHAALRRFQDENDHTNMLATLTAGATALAASGRTEEASLLRTHPPAPDVRGRRRRRRGTAGAAGRGPTGPAGAGGSVPEGRQPDVDMM
jgi:hypothetical protein